LYEGLVLEGYVRQIIHERKFLKIGGVIQRAWVADVTDRGRRALEAGRPVIDVVEEAIRDHGNTFLISRGGEQLGEVDGYRNSKDGVIFFRAGVEVREGDWLEDTTSHAAFFVKEVDLLRDSGRPLCMKVFYETRIAYERHESSSQVIAMLDNIADAIWTLSDGKMPPEDKERARALVRELQDIVRRLPAGAAEGIAGEITWRLLGG
jgi:hypothetical protein